MTAPNSPDSYNADEASPTQEDASALFDLGFRYRNGDLSLLKDNAKAIECFQKAVVQGHPIARFMLDSIFDNGDGFPRGDEGIVNWYQQRATQGDVFSQFYLGCLFALAAC